MTRRTGLWCLVLTAIGLASGCGHCCKHPLLFAKRPANCCPPGGAVRGDPYLPAVTPGPPPPGVGAPPPGAIGTTPAFSSPGPSADVIVPGPTLNGRPPAYYYNGR